MNYEHQPKTNNVPFLPRRLLKDAKERAAHKHGAMPASYVTSVGAVAHPEHQKYIATAPDPAARSLRHATYSPEQTLSVG